MLNLATKCILKMQNWSQITGIISEHYLLEQFCIELKKCMWEKLGKKIKKDSLRVGFGSVYQHLQTNMQLQRCASLRVGLLEFSFLVTTDTCEQIHFNKRQPSEKTRLIIPKWDLSFISSWPAYREWKQSLLYSLHSDSKTHPCVS